MSDAGKASTRSTGRRVSVVLGAVALLAAAAGVHAAAPVSYLREVAPLFRQHCNGCHRPGKEKGGVDLTSVAGILRGGKHGPAVVPGDPRAGTLLGEVSGPDAAMPKEGDRVPEAGVALLERWIREGAHDDTPPEADPGPTQYAAPPVIPAMAWSPDGRRLVVAAVRELVVLDPAGLARVARWPGGVPRAEAIAFSPDGTRLAVSGGSPGVAGIVQVWDVASGRREGQWRLANDSLLGVAWSPDGKRIACGGSDRVVRVVSAADGREEMQFQQHSEWATGAVFLKDGQRLVSGSRDRALKLVAVAGGRLLDVLNRESEPVVALARHPSEDWVAFAGADARVRLYKAEAKADNTDPGRDPNFIREFEHFDGGTTALAFSADGGRLAVAGLPAGEVRVHGVSDGRRLATLKGHGGAVFALAFSPDGTRLATAGYEGVVRLFDTAKGQLLTNAVPVPVGPVASR